MTVTLLVFSLEKMNWGSTNDLTLTAVLGACVRLAVGFLFSFTHSLGDLVFGGI